MNPESRTLIHPLTPEALDPEILRRHVYPNLDRTLYWSPSWDPDFYIALARSGFISISTDAPGHGPILLIELQASYAVLDWKNLHLSRKLERLLRSPQLEAEAIELRVVPDPSRVIERILEHHRPLTWLTEPYQDLLQRLAVANSPDFSLHGVELWSNRCHQLIAGELGYTIGRTYTSLSGFHTRDTPESHSWRHFGTLQMWLLAERLRDRGFAFWNMGHTGQAYKRRLGARVVAREAFLRRWLAAVEDPGAGDLG